MELEPTVTVANDIPGGGASYAFEWMYYANHQDFADLFPDNQSYDGWILISVGPDRI